MFASQRVNVYRELPPSRIAEADHIRSFSVTGDPHATASSTAPLSAKHLNSELVFPSAHPSSRAEVTYLDQWLRSKLSKLPLQLRTAPDPYSVYHTNKTQAKHGRTGTTGAAAGAAAAAGPATGAAAKRGVTSSTQPATLASTALSQAALIHSHIDVLDLVYPLPLEHKVQTTYLTALHEVGRQVATYSKQRGQLIFDIVSGAFLPP
jgi:hypothetical protein